MTQILNAIVIAALTWCIGCLGMPTNLETPIGYLRYENSTEATLSKNEDDNLINTNKTKTQSYELSKLSSTEESPMIQIKVLDQLKAEQTTKAMTDKSNDKERHTKEEDNKFKDSPKDVTAEEITKQSEVWKDLEDDFSLLQDRMPDLTEEQFIELNKEDAIPWNFLKSLDLKREINEYKPKEVEPIQTPIYITVPIIINTHSTLPISVTIGGQSVPLKLTGDIKVFSIPAPSAKEEHVANTVTHTSSFNKLMDYAEPPPRQTNRHRSNIRSKIYARNNDHQVEEFEYKQNSEFLKKSQ